ncbi:MAG: phosphomethylpyrimidine kinase [Chloroflexi bacterium]|nr:phosphomethylpyrimidine kinase [Chloroflexota bacterium]
MDDSNPRPLPARSPPVALAIGGSDSGGGAGIQADLKAFAALGVYGTCAITALTAQNTLGVRGAVETPADFVGHQIDAVVVDFHPNATKTGMLASEAIIEVVIAKLQEHGLHPLVVDPVIWATTGQSLLAPPAIEPFRRLLIPLATVVTPNTVEAKALIGVHIANSSDAREAARALHDLGAQYVIVKGGHMVGDDAVDVLFDGSTFIEFSRPRLQVRDTHGTGCTFAAAITAGLALGLSVPSAIDQAKDLVTEALRHGLRLGAGAGPVNGLALLYEKAGPPSDLGSDDPPSG